MIDRDRTLIVGTGSQSVRVHLTETAARMLDDLLGASPEGFLGDHHPLLTTIAVGRTAAGWHGDGALVIDAIDIIEVVEHSGGGHDLRHAAPAPRVRS